MPTTCCDILKGLTVITLMVAGGLIDSKIYHGSGVLGAGVVVVATLLIKLIHCLYGHWHNHTQFYALTSPSVQHKTVKHQQSLIINRK